MPNEELNHILTKATLMEMMGNALLQNCLFILYIDRRKTCRRRSQFSYTGFVNVNKGIISKGSMNKQVIHAS